MKIIIDDDGYIVGIGETEAKARADAVDSILGWSCRDYIVAIVNDMTCGEPTSDLTNRVKASGGDTPYAYLGGGKFGTPEEAGGST